MKDATLISVVTPIYNGAQFLQSAYDCLCRQTYRHWQWVVVDDGSTDDTHRLMRALSDSDRRVRYTWQQNSGSAKQPRDRAVFQSNGDLILPFDIDDRLADDYLQKMLERLNETDADIVYPQMLFTDLVTGEVTETLPVADFDTSRIYKGSDLVKETMPEWRIGCNGGLYRREMWVNMSWLEEHEPIWTYSDEVDERYYLMKASRVAFSEAQYFYLIHQDSITNKISAKLFHLLKNNTQLANLMKQKFGRDSEEYRLANQKVLNGWRSMMAYYLQHYEELFDADGQIQTDLSEAYAQIEPSLLPMKDRIHFLFFCNEHLLQALIALKYSPKWLKEKIIQRFSNEKYRFNVIRERTEQLTRQQISKSYTEAGAKSHVEPYAVSMFCGNTASGGLVDRLRGAVSLYAACKEANRPFRLFFTHPFPLTDYLQPNTYDWRINADEVSFAPSQVQTVVLDTQTDAEWEREWQRQQFAKALREEPRLQLHFYSNAMFSYDDDFSALFHELFKPSDRLQESIDNILRETGGRYLTVSARFCNLLNDFNEETFSEPLSTSERKQLIAACMAQVERIHQQNSQLPIIVCSDSTTFANEAKTLSYVSVIPGNVSHIGNDTVRYYQYYEKTFLDFYIISQAQRVFLLRAKGMHNSGFPYAAARVGKRPYKLVDF